MKILFALNQDLDNKLETKILSEFKRIQGYNFEFDKAINMRQVREKISQDFDLLILNEELDINNPVKISEIVDIRNLSQEMRIILIVNSENKDETFIEIMHSLGIYDLLLTEDISMDNLLNLIIDLRTETGNTKYTMESKQVIYDDKLNVMEEKIMKNFIIGIGGAGSGSGVTHTAIAIASFIKKMGCKVAIIEFNSRPRLKNLLIYADSRNDGFFTINGIDVFYQTNSKQELEKYNNCLFQSKASNYKYIIIDFGALKKVNDKGIIEPTLSYSEMYRTDHQILCLNGSQWGWADINFYRCDVLAEVEPYIGSWVVSVNLATALGFKEIKKEVQNTTVLRNIKRAPVFINPFNIDEEISRYLADILKNVVSINSLKKGNKFVSSLTRKGEDILKVLTN